MVPKIAWCDKQVGSASVSWFERDDKVVSMPGVPQEMIAMSEEIIPVAREV